jgi:error-prone DNA polymerase
MVAYAELQAISNYSFLRGAAHPNELVETAKELGLSAIALTDRNTLAGVVRAYVAAKEAGLRLVIGCRLDLIDGPSFLCLPKDRAAYGRLCRLLTLGKRRAEKGDCILTLEDVYAHAEGQIFILIPSERLEYAAFEAQLRRIAGSLDAPLYLAAHYLYRGDDRRRIAELDTIAQACGTPLVVTGDVHYHVPGRRLLQDTLTCIREHCTIKEAGYRLYANAERHLKSPEEMARLFAGYEEAVSRTIEIAETCRFSLDDLAYNYPNEPVPPGGTPQAHLEELTWAGAEKRYSGGVPEKVRKTLEKELALIGTLNYAPYFLTVHDIVTWARSEEILCQGRGSAANSAVCYCLYITSVDPMEIDLLFERFVSAERKEPPDIDVDFEHERREEVMQYIYRRYGRERAGIAATVICYRSRSSVRDVGKVFGLSEDSISAITGMVWGWSSKGVPDDQVREAGLDPRDPDLRRVLYLCAELIGFPRHLSQHVGGFVLTQDPLCEVVPIGNAAMEDRTFIEWDKDDLDALRILKIDVLALGMLTCLRKGFALIERHHGQSFTIETVPKGRPEVYDMLCRADAIGVFQVESRAQLSMLPRLKPREFYDLVIEVAIVRPGPIQGNMVHPYLRRRSDQEDVTYPKPSPEHGPPDELKHILKKTYGIPLFQEQAMQLAIVAAKFSPDEANHLRRSMATFRRLGTIGTFRDKFVAGMTRRGYDPGYAAQCFQMIEGFGDYGFPESHAASFALLAYVSAWMKWAYPEVFAAALLNAQPMGFYAPAQIVRDAREHGVEIRDVDVNFSEWNCTLEPSGKSTNGRALRLGLRQIDGMSEDPANEIGCNRERPYDDIYDLWHRTHISAAMLGKLAAADAFRSMGIDRRQALWQVGAIKAEQPLPLFQYSQSREQAIEQEVTLPEMPLGEHVIADYQTLRLSLKAHPVSFLRPNFDRLGIVPAERLRTLSDGAEVAVAGLVLVRQRPNTASGVIFMTIEDETGIANVVIWSGTFERYRKIVIGSRLALIGGRLQRKENTIHVVANRLKDLSHLFGRLSDDRSIDNRSTKALFADLHAHPRDVRIIPKSRDFH